MENTNNIFAGANTTEMEFAAALTKGVNDTFKRADMENNVAIGVSSVATIGGLALTGVGIYTAMKSNMYLGATVAVAGLVVAGLGGYKLVDSVNQKKVTSALIKGMEEYNNMVNETK